MDILLCEQGLPLALMSILLILINLIEESAHRIDLQTESHVLQGSISLSHLCERGDEKGNL